MMLSVFQKEGFKRWLSGAVMALLASTAMATDRAAQTDVVDRVKAAFIYNIAKFVVWPDASYIARPDSFRVCFMDAHLLQSGFKSIENKWIQNRQIERADLDRPQAIHGCDMLILDHTDLELIAMHADNSPVLVIADMTGLPEQQHKAQPGVVINLMRRQNSIGFGVHLQQAEERRLQMSSELLKLAVILDQGA